MGWPWGGRLPTSGCDHPQLSVKTPGGGGGGGGVKAGVRGGGVFLPGVGGGASGRGLGGRPARGEGGGLGLGSPSWWNWS